MPHCLIEHSATLDGNPLISHVFNGVFQSGLFEPDGSDIKVRAISFSDYCVGYSQDDFIHVTLRILSGRSVDKKRLLVKSVMKHLNAEELKNCSISVEVVDIDSKIYEKVLL